MRIYMSTDWLDGDGGRSLHFSLRRPPIRSFIYRQFILSEIIERKGENLSIGQKSCTSLCPVCDLAPPFGSEQTYRMRERDMNTIQKQFLTEYQSIRILQTLLLELN